MIAAAGGAVQGRPGQKSGRDSSLWEGGPGQPTRRWRIWPYAQEGKAGDEQIVAAVFADGARSHRILAEKKVRARDVDLGLITARLPALQGGLLFWADTLGPKSSNCSSRWKARRALPSDADALELGRGTGLL
jgi:hypothetical protein